MKKLGLEIGKKLRDDCSHVQWIDLTQNDFDREPQTITAILQGLRKQKELIYVGLSAQESHIDQVVKLVQPKKAAISLNIRNSKLTKLSANYLDRMLLTPDTMLTGLNLKYCFLSFEQVLVLSNGLRNTKNLVKLDLSNNGLIPAVARHVLDALSVNMSIMDVNFHGNFLNNEFAVDLSYVLEVNSILHSVDLSQNPIAPEGAKYILNALLQFNDTLGSLGDLSQNVYMGVRVREEIYQALRLNTQQASQKKVMLAQITQGRKKEFVEGSQLEKPTTKNDVQTPLSVQREYPLLKPITFTNLIDDDYMESMTWNLKQ